MVKKVIQSAFTSAVFLLFFSSVSSLVQAEVVSKLQGANGASLAGTTPINSGRGFIKPDGASGAYTVWPDSRTGDTAIYAQKLSSTGTVGWTAGGVNLRTNDASNTYSLQDLEVVAGAPYLCVAKTVDSSAYSFEILKLNTSTGAVASSTEVSAANSIDHCYLHASTDNELFVSWSVNDGSGEEDLYLQKFDSSLNAQFGPVVTVRASENISETYAVAPLGSNLAVVWGEQTGSAITIRAQLYDNSGVPQWGGPNTLSSVGNVSGGFTMDTLELAAAGTSDRVIVSWIGYDGSSHFEVEAQLFNAAGSLSWGNGLSLEQYGGITGPVGTVFNSDGEATFVWDRNSGAQNTRWTMMQTVSDAGTELLNGGEPLRVSKTDFIYQTYQEGVVAYNGKVYVMYYYDVYDAVNEGPDMYMAIIENDGTVVSQGLTLVNADFDQYSTNPTADYSNFVLSNDRLFHFWNDFRNNYDDDNYYNVYLPAYQISSLAGGLDVKVSSTTVLSTSGTGAAGTQTAIIEEESSDKPIAAASVAFTQDRAWGSVTAETDTTAGKAYVHNLASAAGVSGTLTLYVPKLSGHGAVYICPSASSLAAVTSSCSGGYALTSADSNVSTVTVASQDYWVVSGLTGTGGLSLASAPASATPTPSPSASTQPGINPNFNQAFTASDGLVCRDQIITLEWRTKGMDVVTLNGEKVSAEGSRQVSVKERTEYLLKGNGAEGTIESRLTIEIDPDQSTCLTSQPATPTTVKTTVYNTAGKVVKTITQPLPTLEEVRAEPTMAPSPSSSTKTVSANPTKSKTTTVVKPTWWSKALPIGGGLILGLFLLLSGWKRRKKTVKTMSQDKQ